MLRLNFFLRITVTIIFAIKSSLLLSQNIEVKGTADFGITQSDLKVVDGNSTIATSYTLTDCGLNYSVSNLKLTQKPGSTGPGSIQPATLAITALTPCTELVKAFLYAPASGTGGAITATIITPQNNTHTVNLNNIGQGADVCWGYGGTVGYRADITNIITGSGIYTLSGFPVQAAPGLETHGASIFLIYKDPSQNYNGSIVIADGALAVPFPSTTTSVTISGFNVCNNPFYSNNFILVGDLQMVGGASFKLNSSTNNYTLAAINQTFYDFIVDTISPPVIGQTNANYGITSNGDCFVILFAGMYYRTYCSACSYTPAANNLTVTSSNTMVCVGNTVALTASGSSNYSWSNGANSSSIVITPSVNTTFWVYGYDNSNCYSANFTQSVSVCNSLSESISEENKIKIYPNPVKDKVVISCNSSENIISVKLYNHMGKLIHHEENLSEINEVDLGVIKSGIYFIEINAHGNYQRFKIIKE